MDGAISLWHIVTLPTSGTVDFMDSDVISRKLKPTTDSDDKCSIQTNCRLRLISDIEKSSPVGDAEMTEVKSSETSVIFIVSPAVQNSFGVVLPIKSAEDCSVYHTEQSGWLRKDRYK